MLCSAGLILACIYVSAGGARATSRSLLASLHALGEAEAALAAARQKLGAVEAELKQGAGNVGRYKK